MDLFWTAIGSVATTLVLYVIDRAAGAHHQQPHRSAPSAAMEPLLGPLAGLP